MCLAGNDVSGVLDAGKHVLAFEPVVAFENRLDGVARGEHAEYVLDRQSPSPDNRLAAEDFGIIGNPLK